MDCLPFSATPGARAIPPREPRSEECLGSDVSSPTTRAAEGSLARSSRLQARAHRVRASTDAPNRLRCPGTLQSKTNSECRNSSATAERDSTLPNQPTAGHRGRSPTGGLCEQWPRQSFEIRAETGSAPLLGRAPAREPAFPILIRSRESLPRSRLHWRSEL